jgi:hypothetical protein
VDKWSKIFAKYLTQGTQFDPETHVDEVGEVVDEVLLDGRVGRVHGQQVLVPGLGGLQPGVLVLLVPLLVLLLDLGSML